MLLTLWKKILWFAPCQLSPRLTKPTKCSVRSAKTQIRLGIRPDWPVFSVRMKKPWVLSYPLSAQRRLWSAWWMSRLIWVFAGRTGHFVGFVMLQLNYFSSFWKPQVWMEMWGWGWGGACLSLALGILVIEPRQANLCLRAFRLDKF